MNILVTGATGFVGRGLLPLLAARGHAGVATGRTVPADLPPGWIGAARDRVLADAPAPRRVPAFPARLKAIEETSMFPCDKLVAAGFHHPQTMKEGLAEMIRAAM